MESSSKVLMISSGVLAVVVAALVSLLLARQPATTAMLPNAQVGAVRLAHVKAAGRSLHLVLRSIYDDMLVRATQTTSAPRRVHAAVRQAQRAASRHQRIGM